MTTICISCCKYLMVYFHLINWVAYYCHSTVVRTTENNIVVPFRNSAAITWNLYANGSLKNAQQLWYNFQPEKHYLKKYNTNLQK